MRKEVLEIDGIPVKLLKERSYEKIPSNFFENKHILEIEKEEDGDSIILFWIEVLLKTEYIAEDKSKLFYWEYTDLDNSALHAFFWFPKEFYDRAIGILEEHGLMKRTKHSLRLFPFWNGRRFSRKNDRDAAKVQKWRLAVFERDNYTCWHCGRSGIKLNAHHIRSWKNYPDLRFVVGNGVTLCEECHKEYHQLYGRAKD